MGITSSPVYCVTLYAELEDVEEDTQYPLEDILNKYYVNCTEIMEEKEEAGKRIFIFEVEGENIEAMRDESTRVFEVDGDLLEEFRCCMRVEHEKFI